MRIDADLSALFLLLKNGTEVLENGTEVLDRKVLLLKEGGGR